MKIQEIIDVFQEMIDVSGDLPTDDIYIEALATAINHLYYVKEIEEIDDACKNVGCKEWRWGLPGNCRRYNGLSLNRFVDCAKYMNDWPGVDDLAVGERI